MSRQLILTFHGLGEPPRSAAESERRVWVPVQWLQAILDALPAGGVRLAFDDGNASDVEHALPMIAQRGMRAHFFPLTGRIGAAGYLGEHDIVRLRDAGMVIGSHGVHHCPWRRLDDRELFDELDVSRRELSRIVGKEVTDAACPFGSYDRRVLKALRAAGYRRAFTSDGGPARTSSWLAPRTTVDLSHPLEHWLKLARTGPHGPSDPVLLGKRLVKRLR